MSVCPDDDLLNGSFSWSGSGYFFGSKRMMEFLSYHVDFLPPLQKSNRSIDSGSLLVYVSSCLQIVHKVSGRVAVHSLG